MALVKGNTDTDEVAKDNAENEDTGKDNAIQNLIFYSFYPATCMVPMEQNMIVINESVPDLMKVQKGDPLLQETIKTFQSILQEKDDEILNLRRNINNDSKELAQVQSANTQTDVTLDQCNEWENQIIILTKDLPEKNERIYQLQQQLSIQQKLLDEPNVKDIDDEKVLRPSQSKTESDLDEAYKNLLELEEKNSILQTEITEMTEKCKQLEFQLVDINELKIEIEQAKIQTEDSLYELETVLEKKDLEIQRLSVQVNGGELLSSEDSLKQSRNNANSTTKMDDIDGVIVELKKKIYKESYASDLLACLAEHTLSYEKFQGMSEKEVIFNILQTCCEETTTEKDLIELVPILKSVCYQDDGKVDIKNMKSNIKKNKNLYEKLNKKQLIQESINIGIRLKIMENLSKLNLSDLKKEYIKLENILNSFNKVFKLTQLGVLNRMSCKDLIEAILEKVETILEISMHSFWEVVLNTDLKQNEVKNVTSFTSADQEIICSNLFPEFQRAETFIETMSMLKNMRFILLYGELTKEKQKENLILFMKLYGTNVIHDITNHILPKYPKEMRCKMTEITVEESVADVFKFSDNISPAFISLIKDTDNINQQEFGDISSIYGYSWDILNLLSILNFEDEFFLISTTLQKQELLCNVLTQSSSTRKAEKSVTKVNLQKNIKDRLMEYILKFQYVINNEGIQTAYDSCKGKSELDLAKVLIKKKESLLKLMFKDTFSPSIDKFTINRSSQYLSCASKEKLNLDFWIKMVLEYYQKEQVKSLQGLTDDEVQICYKRLVKAIELVCPQLLEKQSKNKITKPHMIKCIFLYRNVLIRKLQESFIGKKFKLQLWQDFEESLQNQTTDETQQENRFEIVKKYFEVPLLKLDETDLNDVLMRLYDIDKELFPGSSDGMRDNSKLAKSIYSSDILNEIVYLRLSIVSSIIFMIGTSEDMKETVKSDIDRWTVMKKIESSLLNLDIEIDKDLIESEKNLLQRLLQGCKNSKEINEEKLKLAFTEVNQISCRNNGEVFNLAHSDKIFDKIPTKEKKLEMIYGEVNKVLNSFGRKSDFWALEDNYIKLDRVMEDIENDLSKNKTNIKNTWIYSLYEKVSDIKNLISNNVEKEDLSNESMRININNNLEEIKLWISNSRKLQEKSYNRLNNIIRKLNTASGKSRRKVKILSRIDSDFDTCFDEKLAFEKALSDLEEYSNEMGTKTNRIDNFRMIVDSKILKMTDDDLRQRIVSLEKDLPGNILGNTQIQETISSRSREDLEEDCHRLVYNTIIKNVEEYLKVESDEIIKKQVASDNQSSPYDENLILKINKYQDVCDSVDRWRLPELDSKGKMSPSSYQYESSSTGAYSQIINSKKASILNNSSDDLDSYFKSRLNELQKYGKNPKVPKDYASTMKYINNSDVLVDGFDIEDERTPRYYSMRLQDIQHGRREDELGTMVYKMEQERQEILEHNKHLQQQIFINEKLIETQQLKLNVLEKSDQITRSRLKDKNADEKKDKEFENRSKEINLLKYENENLSATILATHRHLDRQNADLVDISILNNNLQHENAQLTIKNKYLLRSFHKLEDLYKEVIHRLENYKLTVEADRDTIKEIDLDSRLRQSERDKIELVKKLDILDKQNGLLKIHCENLDFQLSKSNKTLAESQALADNYLHQVRQLTVILDNMKVKDEDIRRLKNKVTQ